MQVSIDRTGERITATLETRGRKPGPADIATAVNAVWDEALAKTENQLDAAVRVDTVVLGMTVRTTLSGWA